MKEDRKGKRPRRRWVPRFLRKRAFTPARLARSMTVVPRSPGDQVVFNLGPLPTCRVWLRVSNQADIDVELERIIVNVWYGVRVVELLGIDRVAIAAGSTQQVFLEVALTEAQVDYVIGDYDHSYRAVNYRVYFCTERCRFSVFSHQIESVDIKLTNIQKDRLEASPCPPALH